MFCEYNQLRKQENMYFYRKINPIKSILNAILIKRKSNSVNSIRGLSTKTIDVNTNVTKDVILFKFKNDRNFKIANIFAICQFGCWTYLSTFAASSLKDAPVEKSENGAWWQKINLGENKYRNGLIFLTFTIGLLNIYTGKRHLNTFS